MCWLLLARWLEELAYLSDGWTRDNLPGESEREVEPGIPPASAWTPPTGYGRARRARVQGRGWGRQREREREPATTPAHFLSLLSPCFLIISLSLAPPSAPYSLLLTPLLLRRTHPPAIHPNRYHNYMNIMVSSVRTGTRARESNPWTTTTPFTLPRIKKKKTIPPSFHPSRSFFFLFSSPVFP